MGVEVVSGESEETREGIGAGSGRASRASMETLLAEEGELAPARALEIALASVEALAAAHAKGQIATHVTPAAMRLEQSADGAIGFELVAASVRGAGVSSWEADTLPYMAPEQTGRVAVAVDHRADFYALGVIFTRIFCGRLPLTATDTMGWVHAHIAHAPAPLGEEAQWGGSALAALVARLLEKSPDARYQSIHGLRADLQKIQEHLGLGKLPSFSIGEEDRAESLRMPSELFGRQREFEGLESCWQRAREGGVMVALVEGWEGIGKSALVERLRAQVAAGQGYFISGAFERSARAVPFEPLLHALADLVRQLLVESEDRVAMWRERLLDALGPNVGLMTDVIPALELIVGKHEAPPSSGVAESQNRFILTFTRCVEVFCDAEHPLVIFFDDAQWADVATLELMLSLLSDANASHLLFVGAWRGNEVDDREHPWYKFVDDLGLTPRPVTHLELQALHATDCLEFVASALRMPGDEVEALATALRRKSDGNPLFLRQLMLAMVEQEALWFDREARRWRWDIERIEGIELDENIVELFATKIADLDTRLARTLRAASCIGMRFDLDLLASVLERPSEEVAARLEEGARAGLLARAVRSGSYRFPHERIQQAAYEGLAPKDALELHLAIGRAMREAYALHPTADARFGLVEQLGLVLDALDADEKIDFATLALGAATHASDSMAIDFAVRCIEDANRALDGLDSWGAHYSLKFGLVMAEAEARYLLGDFERAEALFAMANERARDDLERASVATGHVELLGHLGRHEEAVKLGVQALAALGYKVNDDPSTLAVVSEVGRVRWALGRRTAEQLRDAPEMTDARTLAMMRLIYAVAASANFVRKNLFPLFALRMTNLSLRHGHMELSSFAYASYGLILGAVLGNHALGTKFGELALELSERYEVEQPAAYVRVRFLLGGMIAPWTGSPHVALEHLQRALDVGMECGDFLYAGYAATIVADQLLFTGAPASQCLERARELDVALLRGSDRDAINMARCSFQAMRAMAGETNALSELESEAYDERAHLDEMRAWDNQNPYFFQRLYKMQLLVLDDQILEALEIARSTREAPEGTLGLVAPMEHVFYDGVICARAYTLVPVHERGKVLSRTRKCRAVLEKVAARSPEGFTHRVLLLRALEASARSNHSEAARLFEDAIARSLEVDARHIAALASHFAAMHHADLGRAVASSAYRDRAIALWGELGARAAVARWIARAPDGAREDPSSAQGGESPEPSRRTEGLDVATILKANQAISGEIQLDRLLEQMMRITIENAGATRGVFLFFDPQDGLVVDAVGVAGGEVEVLQHTPLDAFDEVASGAVAFVSRTKESLVIEDITQRADFARDPWVLASGVRSLLCQPIVHKGAIMGVICLENDLAANVFTPARSQILDVLSGQLAISLENALMYEEVERARQDLEARVKARTLELEEEVAERERAQAAALDASASKSLFLANMSHELRTPLNAIIGYSELMTEDMEDDGVEEYLPDLAKIRVAARHLLSLINDVLDLSKIEARKMDLLTSEIDLEDFIGEVVTTAMPLFDKGHNSFEYASCRGFIEADRTKLRQVLLNLLSNAAKFTEAGTIELRVSKHEDEEGKRWIDFAVRDDGIGISPEQQERLFKAFNQAEATTSSKYGGTGLGLALSKELCRLMGGDVHLESVVGEGSTFTVRLPAP